MYVSCNITSIIVEAAVKKLSDHHQQHNNSLNKQQ